MAQFACTVYADSKKEALEKEKNVKNWDKYEQAEDNIFYDAVKIG